MSLQSPSSIFAKLDVPLALKFTLPFPKPSHNPKNQDVVFISTDYDEGGIYKYNLTTNSFNKMWTYTQTFTNAVEHGQFLDAKNELLYILAGDVIGIFDLNAKVMNVDTANALCDGSFFPESAYIASTNECHVLSKTLEDSIHYKMDMNNKKINKMKMNTINVTYANMLYIPYTKQLMCFEDKSDTIWYCNIEQISNTSTQKYDWQPYHLKMPHCKDWWGFDILLAFDNIIFIFYYLSENEEDIWCIDLLNNKLIKTKYDSPKFEDYYLNMYVMKDSNNYGHFINFCSG
eukprot:484088_1